MRKLIVGNWKMYPTLSDSVVLAGSLKHSLEALRGVEVALAPPTAWLMPVLEHWKHKLPQVSFAAQNIWADDQGAYTGEVSAYFLKSIVKYVILGHSERRRYLGESSDLVNQKVLSAMRWRIKPIICVGELKKAIDEKGQIKEKDYQQLVSQLQESCEGIRKEYLSEITIAYEPVWAIGASAASAEYVVDVIKRLRQELAKEYGSAADNVRFIYGGSVEASNAGEFLRHSEIQGLLVGSASVKAKEFSQICQIASQIN